MNVQHQPEHIEESERAVPAKRISVTRILALLALLALLTGSSAPLVAERAVAEARKIKAIAQSKPLRSVSKPLPTAAPSPVPTAAPTATPARAAQAVAIGTNVGLWEFDTTALEIAAGDDVALTFNNSAKTTQHNWVLVGGDDYAALEINMAGAQSGEAAGYIPDDTRIIASTAGLVGGGQSQSVTFSAPPAGTYVYLCTVPGHFELGMQGLLTVR
ncbi:MAG TPA: plastocyanin/azurin family copper-binding protein [Roseiflexaceae bacterium]|nr:plastocyanin/azurin family copper-binding protein [Roseiflexaceae bacterium]